MVKLNGKYRSMKDVNSKLAGILFIILINNWAFYSFYAFPWVDVSQE